MLKQPVTNKADMYRRLQLGEFGNTVPQWNDFATWQMENVWQIRELTEEDVLGAPRIAASSWLRCTYPYWGVRTQTPGGPCALNVKWEERVSVLAGVRTRGARNQHFPMVDRIAGVTLWANVWESPTGLVVEGIENPPKGSSWRELMPRPDVFRQWRGVLARSVLHRHMNPNSYDDLCELLENYPNHVVEFSALDRCFGTCRGRNCVVWEVRSY